MVLGKRLKERVFTAGATRQTSQRCSPIDDMEGSVRCSLVPSKYLGVAREPPQREHVSSATTNLTTLANRQQGSHLQDCHKLSCATPTLNAN